MKLLRLFLIFILLFKFDLVFSAFDNIDVSSKNVKIANAGAGISSGVSSIYYNPAGLSDMKKRELNIEYSKLLLKVDNDSLNYLNLMFGFGIKKVRFGISYNQFSSELYSEHVISVSGAKNLFKIKRKYLSLGVRLKILKLGYEENEYTKLDSLFIKNGYAKSIFGLDFGVLCYSKDGFSYGITLKDINSPDITLNDSGHKLPLKIKAGVGYRWPLKQKYLLMDELLILCDFNYKKDVYSFHIGVEPALFDYILLPGIGFGFGNKSMRFITAGITYQLPIEGISYNFKMISYMLRINYAFKFHLGGFSSGTYGDHFLSINFLF